jgi:hypothetical protein
MRSLKLLCLAAIVAVSSVMGSTASNTAKAESGFARNYKMAVSGEIAIWVNRLQNLNGDVLAYKLQIDQLKRASPPPANLDAELKDKQRLLTNAHNSMFTFTKALEQGIAGIIATTETSSEGPALATFVASEIKRQAGALYQTQTASADMKWTPGIGKTGTVHGTISLKLLES